MDRMSSYEITCSLLREAKYMLEILLAALEHYHSRLEETEKRWLTLFGVLEEQLMESKCCLCVIIKEGGLGKIESPLTDDFEPRLA
jgi:hypothetical protein